MAATNGQSHRNRYLNAPPVDVHGVLPLVSLWTVAEHSIVFSRAEPAKEECPHDNHAHQDPEPFLRAQAIDIAQDLRVEMAHSIAFSTKRRSRGHFHALNQV